MDAAIADSLTACVGSRPFARGDAPSLLACTKHSSGEQDSRQAYRARSGQLPSNSLIVGQEMLGQQFAQRDATAHPLLPPPPPTAERVAILPALLLVRRPARWAATAVGTGEGVYRAVRMKEGWRGVECTATNHSRLEIYGRELLISSFSNF